MNYDNTRQVFQDFSSFPFVTLTNNYLQIDTLPLTEREWEQRRVTVSTLRFFFSVFFFFYY